MEWINKGSCSQTDPEAFFPEVGSSTKLAKKVCSRCDVLDQCLSYALQDSGLTGIWGGTSERERRNIRAAA